MSMFEKQGLKNPPPSYKESLQASYAPLQDATHSQTKVHNDDPYWARPYSGDQEMTSNGIVSQPDPASDIRSKARPRDYMIASILALICAWPIGLCAVYYANKAHNLLKEGSLIEAKKTSLIARNLVMASIVVGSVTTALAVITVLHYRAENHMDDNF